MSARIEPERAVVTILFVDVRGFTTSADRSTAREAVEYLNECFAVVVPLVSDHGDRCQIGIGINSGLGAGRDDRRAWGHRARRDRDPVNVAARVRDATRELGEPVLLTEATRLLLDGSHGLVARGTLLCGEQAELGPARRTDCRPMKRFRSRSVEVARARSGRTDSLASCHRGASPRGG